MRRLLSILVAVILGLGPGTAVVSAQVLSLGWAAGWSGHADESHLPACCRRAGKHHCAMDNGAASSLEAGVSAPTSCPCLPRMLASTAPVSPALLGSRTALLPHFVSAAATPTIVLLPGASIRHAWPKRGPPSLQNS